MLFVILLVLLLGGDDEDGDGGGDAGVDDDGVGDQVMTLAMLILKESSHCLVI